MMAASVSHIFIKGLVEDNGSHRAVSWACCKCILNQSLRMVRIPTGLNWLHTARYRTSAISQQFTAFDTEEDP